MLAALLTVHVPLPLHGGLFTPHSSKRGEISLYSNTGSHTSESIVGASFTVTALLYNMAGHGPE